MSIPTFSNIINEGSTASFNAFVHDASGVAIPVASITTLTLTLKNEITNATINSRSTQNVLNANNCTYVSSSGEVTSATNASPIVITSAGHGLATGDYVHVTGCEGLTAANNTLPSGNRLLWQITKIDDNSFSLDGSQGNGTYSNTYIPERGSWSRSKLTWTMQPADNDIIGTVAIGATEAHIATFTVTTATLTVTHEFRYYVKNLRNA